MRKYLFGFVLLVLMGLTACDKFGRKGEVVATVDGSSIYLSDLDKSLESRMQRINMQMYELRKSGLDDLISEKLLEKKAREAGLDVGEFLEKKVFGDIISPSDEELKAMYEARKREGAEPFEEIKEELRKRVLESRQGSRQRQYAAQLKRESETKVYLDAPRVQVSVGDSPAKGPKDAPVTIIEFSDYQCPYCGRARSTVNRILDTYKDKIRYAFRDFPLNFHKDAFLAHEAALCAGDQEKYWEYNKKLFGNQRSMKRPVLDDYAKDLSLDLKKFNECLDTHKYAAAVEKNISDGAAAGVSGTPAFFINGVMLSGARPFADFKRIIDNELDK